MAFRRTVPRAGQESGNRFDSIKRRLKKSFIELLETAERHARTVLFKRRRQLPPTWLLSDGGNDIRKIETPWHSDGEKNLASLMLRTLIRKHNITAYCVVSEVWYAKETKENFDSGKPIVQPRKRPDRKEMVMALATDGKEVHVKSWEIVRNWNEQISELKPHPMQGAGFSGWMVSLLGTPNKFPDL